MKFKILSELTHEEKLVIIFILLSLTVAMFSYRIGKVKFIPPQEGTKKININYPLDLNRANFEELLTLPGIGPTIAQRIISYRYEKGNFKKLEELLKIKGIGKKKLEKLKPYLTIKD